MRRSYSIPSHNTRTNNLTCHSQARDQELPSAVCIADFDILQSSARGGASTGSSAGWGLAGAAEARTGAATPGQVPGPSAAVAAAAAASGERLLAEGQVITAVAQVGPQGDPEVSVCVQVLS